MTTVISVEHLSKAYRLGQIDTRVLVYDLNIWWARVRGKPNPMLRIGETDYGNNGGEELWALKNISFTVKDGDVLGIIGRNGAGKSTLLKILSRVTAPTSGKIKVKGRVASLLEVGTGFHPELTGRENIYLNGSILGMTKAEVTRKFDEIVDFSEVERFIDTPVKRYSSGMYVRLAFAVAAHLDPEILVVDEVLAVGDADFQKKCLGKMGEVAKGGRTVLFVSHNMAAISSLTRLTMVLEKGQNSFIGETSDAVKYYLLSTKNSKNELSSLNHPAGNFFLEKIDILNSDGINTGIFSVGEKMRIDIKGYSNIPDKIEIVIAFYNSYKIRVLTITSKQGTGQLISIEKKFMISCEIPELLFTEDTYLLRLAIYSSGRLLKEIDPFSSIEIIDAGLLGTAYPSKPRHGVVVQRVDWKIGGEE